MWVEGDPSQLSEPADAAQAKPRREAVETVFACRADHAAGVAVSARVSRNSSPGSEPPVVLVHGLGLSHRYMMPVARALAARHETFLPDLPGFGDSGHPPDVLDVAGLADALAGWLDAAGLARVHLLGNSFGCQIIADLAARRPERVDRAVLQGPTTPPGERGWYRQWRRWRQNSPFNPPEMEAIARDDYRRSGYLRVLRSFRLSLRDAMEDKLARIDAPVLVVRGSRDPICRREWAEQVAAGLPNGRLAVMPDVAHTLVYTAPEALAEIASAFFREAGAPPDKPA